MITVAGKHLKEAFEHSVAKMTEDGRDAGGRFLQVSGFKIIYDVRKKPGHRLVSAKAVCRKCKDNEYEDIEDETEYNVVTSNYVAGSGDGYTMLLEHRTNHIIGALDTDVMHYQLENHSPISANLDNRITVVTAEDKEVTNDATDTFIDNQIFFIIPSLLSLLFY